MPIRCVTFEIANTLVRLASPQHALYRKPVCDALRHYRLPVPADDVMKKAFRTSFAIVSNELPHYGGPEGVDERIWWKDLVSQMLAEAGCEEALAADTFELVFQRAYSSFGARDSWAEAPEGAREAMAHCRANGLVVGAVCNTYHRYVDNKLPLLGLHHDLDFAVVSNDACAAKSDKVMWEEAARRANVAHRLLHGGDDGPILPEHVLHIGSSLNDDYLAAKAAGARALLLAPKQAAQHEALSQDEVLRSLTDLPPLVDALLCACE